MLRLVVKITDPNLRRVAKVIKKLEPYEVTVESHEDRLEIWADADEDNGGLDKFASIMDICSDCRCATFQFQLHKRGQ